MFSVHDSRIMMYFGHFRELVIDSVGWYFYLHNCGVNCSS